MKVYRVKETKRGKVTRLQPTGAPIFTTSNVSKLWRFIERCSFDTFIKY